MALESKSKKLHKLKMPVKRSRGLDLASLKEEEAHESPEDEAAESPDEQHMEDELGLELHGHAGDADQGNRDEEGSDEEEASESPDEEAAEPEMGDEHSNPALEHASDDELLAEIKKRGLMDQLEHGDESDQDHGSENDDTSDRSLMY